jgi:gluconolactonase
MKSHHILLYSLFLGIVLGISSCSEPTTVLPIVPTAENPEGQPTIPIPPTKPAMPTIRQTEISLAPMVSYSETDFSVVAGTFQFTEGPAVDAEGNVFFSDINTGRIYRWSADGDVTVFREGLNAPNGLAFARDGSLIICEGGNGRLLSIDAQGSIQVLADSFNGIRFNEPNDLWIDPQGGIYFTDPAFQSMVVQDGQDVYYLPPDHGSVVRVISDLDQPNGIVGTPDGKTLYVADYAAGQTFAYAIQSDGALAEKMLFVAMGSDGLDLDSSGNLYLTGQEGIRIVNPSGQLVQTIPSPQTPTNLAFAGPDRNILFITAKTAAYIIRPRIESGRTATDSPEARSFVLSSPDVAENGLLPMEYTCDGASSTLALQWSGAPAGTQSYVVIMHHFASPMDVHWYWVVYDIPAEVTNLLKNMTGIGKLGTNSVNGKNAYTPPCSKGPGLKTYTYTVYALSAFPTIAVPVNQLDRAAMLDAIRDITLASAELHVNYARP